MDEAGGANAGSGISEFDQILRGGYPRGRLYLLEGRPGSGKTTLAMQFLLEGARLGEKAVYVTFSETASELMQSAKSHNWSLDPIAIVELTKRNAEQAMEDEYTVLHSADVELTQTSTALLERIHELKPARLVLDSLSELRMVARDPLRYRRQILALKQTLTEQGCTVIFLEDLAATGESDPLLQSIAHGVIMLSSELSNGGGVHRRIQVIKMRGVDFIDGLHDCRIVRGGMRIYPRMIAGEVSREQAKRPTEPALATGIVELDELLGGPIPWGFGVMINGPAGCGKSSLAAQMACAAANQGKQVCMYSFEESTNSLLNRCDKIGIDLRKSVQSGRVRIQKVEPSRVTPGEVTHGIGGCFENNGGLVVVDSLNGYVQAMRNDKSLVVHLHELLGYLNERGVITVLVSAQSGVLETQQSQFDATYLADLVIQIRYFEAQGLVREAISVIKNRAELHEKSIREFDVGKHGIRVGQPLRGFQSVLTGVPAFVGENKTLIADIDKDRDN